jgi:hypothetical protein
MYRPGTHDTRDLRRNAVFRIVKPMPMGAPGIEPGKDPRSPPLLTPFRGASLT